VRDGLTRVDRSSPSGSASAQAALIAVDPRTGDPGAGRRPVLQPVATTCDGGAAPAGIVFAVVYLAAFEHAKEQGRPITAATVMPDEPTTFSFNDQEGTPATTVEPEGRSPCAGRWRFPAISWW
jgi:hypothetical protein